MANEKLLVDESPAIPAADPNQKIKILAWGDYCCSTGFATVMGNIMRQLQATGRYEIDVLGINYSGDPFDHDKWPGNVFPAMPGLMSQSPQYGDVYGRQRLLDLAGQGIYDVIFLLQDTFILQTVIKQLKGTQEELAKYPELKTFKTVFYFPIDARPKPDWIEDVVTKVDFPVAYTLYGRREVARYAPAMSQMMYIYHGTNLKDFFPIENREEVAQFRAKYWNGLADNRFLMVNVNRNQPRKDIIRSLMILKELKSRGKDPLLYLHMQHEDVGGNIFVMAEQLGLKNEEDFILPHPRVFNANQGLPVDRLNLIYNAADMVLSTTLGEGWGLSATEAFATKTPFVGPDSTSFHEILANNRGLAIPAGDDPSMWVMKEMDNERLRPVMDVEAAADAIEDLMAGKNLPDIEAAYRWAKAYSWDIVCKSWLQVMDGAAHAARIVNSKPKVNRAQRRALDRRQAKKAKK